MTLKRTLVSLALLSFSFSLAACGDDEAQDGNTGGAGGQSGADLSKMGDVATNYANIVHASYADSLELAQKLDQAIDDLIADPSEETLEAARDAWLASREPYLQTEVYRFYDGPIDHPEDGPEGQINAWPLDEAYIDYVVGDDDAGIVNDTSIEISVEELAALNEQGGEKNIATGYHAIEFLLWGQDLSEDGPGERPYTDYVVGDGQNAERRAEYLKTVSELLLTDLTYLRDAWAPGEDNYRKEFEAAAPAEQLRRILTGMITLSGFETGGERLQAALDTGDQEDEHSCFSDNTHRDMIVDIVGIQNVYLGKYAALDGTEVSGASVRDVIAAQDEDLAEELTARIQTSLELAGDLETPFDREISFDNEEGRARVEALIESLRGQQEPLLEKAFQDFGLTIPTPE